MKDEVIDGKIEQIMDVAEIISKSKQYRDRANKSPGIEIFFDMAIKLINIDVNIHILEHQKEILKILKSERKSNKIERRNK